MQCNASPRITTQRNRIQGPTMYSEGAINSYVADLTSGLLVGSP